MVPARPFFIGSPGWVRSSAWIWLTWGFVGQDVQIGLHRKFPFVDRYPSSEPVCMTRPVSDAASNSHPVAALNGRTNIPLASGEGSGGRDHSLLYGSWCVFRLWLARIFGHWPDIEQAGTNQRSLSHAIV